MPVTTARCMCCFNWKSATNSFMIVLNSISATRHQLKSNWPVWVFVWLFMFMFALRLHRTDLFWLADEIESIIRSIEIIITQSNCKTLRSFHVSTFMSAIWNRLNIMIHRFPHIITSTYQWKFHCDSWSCFEQQFRSRRSEFNRRGILSLLYIM